MTQEVNVTKQLSANDESIQHKTFVLAIYDTKGNKQGYIKLTEESLDKSVIVNTKEDATELSFDEGDVNYIKCNGEVYNTCDLMHEFWFGQVLFEEK